MPIDRQAEIRQRMIQGLMQAPVKTPYEVLRNDQRRCLRRACASSYMAPDAELCRAIRPPKELIKV